MSFSLNVIQVRGISELVELLMKLPDAMRRRVLIGALRAAAKPIAAAAKSNAPVSDEALRGANSLRYGHLRDNIRIVSVRPRNTRADATVLIGTGDAFWGRFVELGRRGRPMRLTPFLGPAVDANVEAALDIFRERALAGLMHAAENLAGPYLKSGFRK